MKYEKGAFVTCDRCCKKTFLKLIGQGEFDGGYTVIDKFEELPKEWSEVSFHYKGKYKYLALCPSCTRMFNKLTRNYESSLENCEFIKDEAEAKKSV